MVQVLEVHDPYFTQRKDCAGRLGFTSLQKCTAAIRFLAYGYAADCIDEYVRMGESTVLDCLHHFCQGGVACFGEEYRRVPTEQDLKNPRSLSKEKFSRNDWEHRLFEVVLEELSYGSTRSIRRERGEACTDD